MIPRQLENGFLFVTAGVTNDGGGFGFYIGSDGKLHVVKVPPWDPEGGGLGPSPINDLVTAAHLMITAETRDGAARTNFEKVAMELVRTALPAVEKSVAENMKESVK